VDFGLWNVDCGLRVKAVYNAFGGVWSDFLTAVGVSGRLAHKSLLVVDFCAFLDCGLEIAECGL